MDVHEELEVIGNSGGGLSDWEKLTDFPSDVYLLLTAVTNASIPTKKVYKCQ